MTTTKYYVRVKLADQLKFEEYTKTNNILIELLSIDIGVNAGAMYAVNMDGDQALAMSLSFPLLGCLNFHKTMGKLSQIKSSQE